MVGYNYYSMSKYFGYENIPLAYKINLYNSTQYRMMRDIFIYGKTTKCTYCIFMKINQIIIGFSQTNRFYLRIGFEEVVFLSV